MNKNMFSGWKDVMAFLCTDYEKPGNEDNTGRFVPDLYLHISGIFPD